MAQYASTSRILASLELPTPMDPTHKIHPKPKPSTTSAVAASPLHQLQSKHHPTTTYPTTEPAATTQSTLQNISLRFSRLYSTHKKLAPNPTKPSNVGSLPQPETHYQDKILTVSPVSHTSCTTLTKSKSHCESYDFAVSKVVVKENDILMKPSKRHPKKSSLKECDVKKASQLMARSLESDQVKKLQEGFEGRRSSVSSFPRISDGGRRKSFCSSQIELTDFFSCNGVKVVAVDMPPFMQIHAVNCARKSHDSLEKFTSKTLAFTLKKEFDAAYGPAWHCIVGTGFGSFVTHSVGGFMYFSMDHKMYILLFKTTVQKAD
ncbi:uncharacterized protein [Primulina huaijiensis]|uniref:uncharacterized protein n=1 Tax=Primulina huaijiensis TaxID=1492673 RepID=UPI003CC73CBB